MAELLMWRFLRQLSGGATNDISGGGSLPDNHEHVGHLGLGVVSVNVVGCAGATKGEGIKQLEVWSSSGFHSRAIISCLFAVFLERHHIVSALVHVFDSDPVLGVVPSERVLIPGNISINCMCNCSSRDDTVKRLNFRFSSCLEGGNDTLEAPKIDEPPGGGLVKRVLPLEGHSCSLL